MFQFVLVGDPQLFLDLRQMQFHRVGGDVHVSRDLPPGPPLGDEHGHGKFRGGQIVRHIMPRIRIMDASPAPREEVDGRDRVCLLQIEVVCLDMQGKGPQARGTATEWIFSRP